MKEINNIECIIFDLDGVLTDTAEYHYCAWKKIAVELGIPFDREKNERLKGVSRMESLDILLEDSQKIFNQEEKERLAERKNSIYLEYIKMITPNDLYEGVQPLINIIRRNQIKVVLASASKNANNIITRLGIREYFDYIVDSNQIQNGKPDPEIFITGAANVNANPEKCVVIEDSYAGIIGAKAAKMLAVGIGEEAVLSNADFVFSKTGMVDLIKISQMIPAVS